MRYGFFLIPIIMAMITGGAVYAQEPDSTCQGMQDYNKVTGSDIPPTFFRQGYQSKCFTVSGAGSYITYTPNDTEIQQLQNIPLSTSQSQLHVLSDSLSALDLSMNTGQSKLVPVKITIDNGSSLSYARFALVNLPPKVQAWMNPMTSDFFEEPIDKNGTAAAIMSVFVDSGAKSGKYDIPIIASEGSIQDSSGNQTQLNQQVIGVLHLSIFGHDDFWSDIGLPTDHQASFCSKATGPGDGTMCSGFDAYEEYPVTVYSSTQRQVQLSLPDIPSGKYARFIPDTLVAGPNGATSTMIVAGIVKPGIPNAMLNPFVTVTATSQGGNKAVNFLQIAESGNLTVINSPKPIDLNSNFGGNGKSGYAIFGTVYDPQDYSSSPLPVKLSVLGLDDNGNIKPMPSWLSVSIPDSTFSLKPTIPYYFTIEFTSDNATDGTYPVAITENIGGSSFTQDVAIKIYKPEIFHGGVMTAPSMGPISNTAEQTPIQIMIPVAIGAVLAGGGFFGIFYITKKK